MASAAIENILLRISTEGDRDAADKLKGLAARLSAFAKEKGEADADVNTDAGERKLKGIRARLDAWKKAKAAAKADVDTAGAQAKVGALQVQLGRLDGKSVEVHARMDTKGFRAGAFAALAALGSLKVQGVAAILALTSSIVFAGVALAGIGAAALGAAIPLGVLAIAVKGRLKEMKKSGNDFFKTFKDGFKKALGPAVDRTLAGLGRGLGSVTKMLPKLSGSFTKLGGAAGKTLEGLLKHISSPAWTKFWKTMIGGSAKALGPIGRGMKSLLDIFKNLATAAMPILISLLNKGADSLAKLAGKTSDIGKLRGAMKQGVGVLSDFWAIAKNLGGVLKGVFDASQSAGFLQALRDATGTLSTMFQSAQGQKALKEFFKAMTPFVKDLAAALPALIPPLTRFVTVANTVFTVVLKVVRELSKIPVIGPSLAALATAFVAWKGPLGTAKTLLKGVSSLLSGLAKKAITKLVVPTATVGGGGATKDAEKAGEQAGGGFLAGLLAKIKSAGKFLSGALAALFSPVGALGAAAFAAGAALGDALMNAFGDKLAGLSTSGGFFTRFIQRWQQFGQRAGIAFSRIGHAVGSLFGGGVGIGGIGSLTASLGHLGSGLIRGVLGMARPVFTAATSVGRGIASGINALAGPIVGVARSILRAVVNNVLAFVGAAFNAGKTVFHGVRRGIAALLGAVVGASRSVLRSVVNAVLSYVGAAFNAGKTVFHGVRRGVAALAGAVGSAARSVASRAVAVVRGFANEAAAAGRIVGHGVANGISALAGAVGSAARSIASHGASAVRGAVGAFASAGRALIQGLINGIESMASSLFSKIAGIIGKAKGLLSHLPHLSTFTAAKQGPLKGDALPNAGRAIVAGLIEGLDQASLGLQAGLTGALATAAGPVGVPVGRAPVPVTERLERVVQRQGQAAAPVYVTNEFRSFLPPSAQERRRIARDVTEAIGEQTRRPVKVVKR